MNDAIWSGEWAAVARGARAEICRLLDGEPPGDPIVYLTTIEMLATALARIDADNNGGQPCHNET